MDESEVNVPKSYFGKVRKSIYTNAKLGMFRQTNIDPKNEV